MKKGTLPGASAEVRYRDARWTAQVGHADTATGRERTPDDHFRGASITKTFIATVLLQLEAEGKLSLDDSVEEWLPGLVRGAGYDAEAITVRQLLNHTSGVANYTDDRSSSTGPPGRDSRSTATTRTRPRSSWP